MTRRSTVPGLILVVVALSGCAEDLPISVETAADTTQVDSLRAEIRSLNATLDSVHGVVRDLGARVPGGAGISLQEAGETARNWGLRAFWAVVVLSLTAMFVNFSVRILETLAERSAERRLLFKRMPPILRIVAWGVAFYFVVRVILDVDAQGLLAAAAAVGVAIGLAGQDILRNVFGGLVIVFDQPFQVGDKILIGDAYGEVTSIGLRATRIVTPDDSIVTIPNAQLVDNRVSNANSGALDCQVVTDLWLPGWVDEGMAKRIAHQVAASSKYVYLEKPIVVLVRDEFRETFVTHLKVKAYVIDTRDEFRLMSDITERARAEFRSHGMLAPLHGARATIELTPFGRMDAGNGVSEPAVDP